MRYLVVGDLHGQYELVNSALAYEGADKVIFVGDYLDSFSRSPEDQFTTLDLVLDAVKKGRAEGLLGNHELSYLNSKERCSGYRTATQLLVQHRVEDMWNLLKSFTFRGGFLITHAGLSGVLLEGTGQSYTEYLLEGDFNQVGQARGGRSHCGGIRWCDYNYEFSPVDGIKQIFGHTRGQVIREESGNYCIDVLEDGRAVGLLIEAGNAKVVEFGEEAAV